MSGDVCDHHIYGGQEVGIISTEGEAKEKDAAQHLIICRTDRHHDKERSVPRVNSAEAEPATDLGTESAKLRYSQRDLQWRGKLM